MGKPAPSLRCFPISSESVLLRARLKEFEAGATHEKETDDEKEDGIHRELHSCVWITYAVDPRIRSLSLVIITDILLESSELLFSLDGMLKSATSSSTLLRLTSFNLRWTTREFRHMAVI